MSKQEPTFIDLCLSGKVQPERIDDFVGAWHEGDSPLDLHEFLGMSWQEYGAWMIDARALSSILDKRRRQQRKRA